MPTMLSRLLPDFAEAPPPVATAAPDFDRHWFRPTRRAGRPVEADAATVPDAPEADIAGFTPVSILSGSAWQVEDRAALLAAAEARGREAGRAEAEAEAETQIAAERVAFEERLRGARRDWVEAEGAALARGLNAAFAELDATLSQRVARLLAPVLTDALRRQAVDALSAAVTRLLAEPQPSAIAITGPEDLIAALSRRLSGLSAAIAFTAADVAEVTVCAGETVIETELSAWGRLIAAAVAEA